MNELISVEIRNQSFKCGNCQSNSYIKYITEKQTYCNNCITSKEVIRKKASYTPVIIGNYNNGEYIDIEKREAEVRRKLDTLSIKR